MNAAKALMREKGFSDDVAEMFEACFAGGGSETVVTFSGFGEMKDLDLVHLSSMTKNEIIDAFLENRFYEREVIDVRLKEILEDERC